MTSEYGSNYTFSFWEEDPTPSFSIHSPSHPYLEVVISMSEISERINTLRNEIKVDLHRVQDSLQSDLKRIEDVLSSEIGRTESKIEKAEQGLIEEIKEVKSDLRNLLYALIAGLVGLAALMAHGFKWFLTPHNLFLVFHCPTGGIDKKVNRRT